MTLDDADGFVRGVAETGRELLLDAVIVAPEASDLVAELGLAIETGAHLEDLASMVHAHPTLSEVVAEACTIARGEAIHGTNT